MEVRGCKGGKGMHGKVRAVREVRVGTGRKEEVRGGTGCMGGVRRGKRRQGKARRGQLGGLVATGGGKGRKGKVRGIKVMKSE